MFGLWIKPQTNGFHEFVFIVLYFVATGSFTADGGLLQPTEGVKTTPQKTRFRSVNSTRNSRTGQNSVNGYSDKNSIDDTKHKTV